jgi:hypothetical protein
MAKNALRACSARYSRIARCRAAAVSLAGIMRGASGQRKRGEMVNVAKT